MNLLSNAVKFTSKGGFIKIVSKLILNKKEFTYPEMINDE
jgi:signal transduction histidine kinase